MYVNTPFEANILVNAKLVISETSKWSSRYFKAFLYHVIRFGLIDCFSSSEKLFNLFVKIKSTNSLSILYFFLFFRITWVSQHPTPTFFRSIIIYKHNGVLKTLRTLSKIPRSIQFSWWGHHENFFQCYKTVIPKRWRICF